VQIPVSKGQRSFWPQTLSIYQPKLSNFSRYYLCKFCGMHLSRWVTLRVIFRSDCSHDKAQGSDGTLEIHLFAGTSGRSSHTADPFSTL